MHVKSSVRLSDLSDLSDLIDMSGEAGHLVSFFFVRGSLLTSKVVTTSSSEFMEAVRYLREIGHWFDKLQRRDLCPVRY